MWSFLCNLFVLLLLAPGAWSALATDASPAITFYRSKHSLFPSGQVSREELASKLMRTENDMSYRLTWDQKEFVLKGRQILRDIQVARMAETKTSTSIYSLNRFDSLVLHSVPKSTAVEILATDDFWARVKDQKGIREGWVPLHTLQSQHDDLGVYVNIVDAYLRKDPSFSSSIITTLPRLRRVLPLEISKNFLKIKYDEHIGYVDISQFVSRADFASLAYHPKRGWTQVHYRNRNALVFGNQETIELTEVLGYVPNLKKGVVVEADAALVTPPLRARIEILKAEAGLWGLSNLKGHGEVWWKQKDLFAEEDEAAPATQLLTEDLLKREIYSIAFENKTSARGLVSSEGVFRTDDGRQWTMIPLFGKKNYPVSIHPNGTWFVGSYKSTDQGKSFHPFIRWDDIAKVIQSTLHRNPKILKLTQIDALPQAKIEIRIDTGSNIVKLRSSIQSIDWDVITTK